MKIYLIPLGNFRKDLSIKIIENLPGFFYFPIVLLDDNFDISSAYHPVRGQYLSSKILEKMVKIIPSDGLRVI